MIPKDSNLAYEAGTSSRVRCTNPTHTRVVKPLAFCERSLTISVRPAMDCARQPQIDVFTKKNSMWPCACHWLTTALCGK